MQEKNEHFPIYGVGPYYGVGIIILTVIGIVVSEVDILDSGKITKIPLTAIMVAVGIFLIIAGVLVWKAAAIGKYCIDGYIQKNILCTTGVYSIVRNPCYSGIMLICDGIILIAHNLWLLILPVVYWIGMTVLMKITEEKWLANLYGHEYLDYCKKVNRCIPWFPHKK